MEWTEQRIELLTSLSQQGLSARDIATQLGGVTRDAVIGKLYRINRPLSTERVNNRPGRPGVEAVEASETRAAPAATPIIATPAIRQDDVGAATLTALRPDMCRWPFGDPTSDNFRFCGAAADGGSYCHRHAAIAYQPRPDRSRSAMGAVRLSR